MTLAMLAAVGMTDVHAMNALKVVLGGVINGVATFTFMATGTSAWKQAAVMTLGAIIGGYFAPHYSQRLPQSWIRAFLIILGSAVTVDSCFRAAPLPPPH